MLTLSVFEVLAVLTTVTAVFSWINVRYLKLPTTIGLMVISLAFSLALVGLDRLGVGIADWVTPLVAGIDFDQTLLNGMLGALLFAGALHLNINDLIEEKWAIAVLATIGVVASTVLVGGAAWAVFAGLGVEMSLAYCLLFGALISPTDPIAVGAMLKRVGVPGALQTKIAGESLFNDGVGVVLFLVILGVATGQEQVEATGIATLLGVEIVGGLVYGGLLGWVTFQMLRRVDNYHVEILITLALVTGGYALAHRLHLSGPLAMVVAGLLIGNRGRALAMSEQTRERLDAFWELVDEFLNAVLFVLIGVEVMVVELVPTHLAAGLLAIPVVLAARLVSVGVPVQLMRPWRSFSEHTIKMMVWSGLRGGISVALALSLPPSPSRGVLLTVTYVVVCFSILVQGLSMERVVRRLMRAAAPAAAGGPAR